MFLKCIFQQPAKPTNSSHVIFSRGFLLLADWLNATVELANNVVTTTAVAICFRSILVSLMDFLVVLVVSIKLSRLCDRNLCAADQCTHFFE
jgi:hypothetical protein